MNLADRRLALVLPVIALVAIGITLLAMRDPPRDDLRGVEELAAVPDVDFDSAVMAEIAHRSFGRDAKPDAWRSLDGPARHVYAVHVATSDIFLNGLGQWIRDHRQGATTPGPGEFAAGLEGMGLAEAARLATDLPEPDDTKAIDERQRQLREALIAVVPARRAWTRERLPEIIGR